ncbi:hypothetical protein [Candidatus Hamiltonella defensa]|uniref:hypothetical protein n=1 Tax=Candidatus Williamhamiltonella defendens TaxID=138072 RepID=UPI0030DC2A7A
MAFLLKAAFGAYDCRKNCKIIFNQVITPNINENQRNRKTTKRGRHPIFNSTIFSECFRTIERVFAWEDKFWRLFLRFERMSSVHYAFKTLAYTLINLRHVVSRLIKKTDNGFSSVGDTELLLCQPLAKIRSQSSKKFQFWRRAPQFTMIGASRYFIEIFSG